MDGLDISWIVGSIILFLPHLNGLIMNKFRVFVIFTIIYSICYLLLKYDREETYFETYY